MRTMLALNTLLILSVPSLAQEQKMITDPAKTGFEYKMQGEYVTQGSDEVWGAQVIALGDNKFQIEGFKGGLPGDGWKRGDEQSSGQGEKKGDAVAVQGEGWTGTLDGETLVVQNADGETIGTLKKVHRKSPTLNAKPPAGAIVLFDGSSAEHFKNGKLFMEDLLLADCESKETFGDHHLHLEFRTPFKPHARGQARGNSGMYIQGRYEVQVLDSFGLTGENNECGGIYQVAQPRVNMCFPPLTWQTYDYHFTAAKYDNSGKKVANARVTIKHNGVTIHEDLELPKQTPGKYPEANSDGPLYLQGHGNPVAYRNVWVVKK